ncbi:hypothetical protein HXX01_05240, partial [Candidatus Nomurabacteria bacterium]|nr:hypothetical protein [Candidatus Nomurabacteria bacterium]
MTEIENDDDIMANPINNPKMMTLGVAKTKAYNQLRMLSVPFPDETPGEHDLRVENAVIEMIHRAIHKRDINKHLLIVEFEGWHKSYIEITLDSGDDEFISYDTSYLERDQFMQFVNDTAPDLLVLKEVSDEKVPEIFNVPKGLSEKDTKALEELPKLKKKVAELSDEKVKWDASIEAAAKIGLLFYDESHQRPAIPEQPDYKHFARLPYWSINEAITLLAFSQIRYKPFVSNGDFEKVFEQEKLKIDEVLDIKDECGNSAWYYMLVYSDLLIDVPLDENLI